jgi:hypothetical protein
VALVVVLRPPLHGQKQTLANVAQGAHAEADVEELEVDGEEVVVLQSPGQSTLIWIADEGDKRSGR